MKPFFAYFLFILPLFLHGKKTNFVLVMADDQGWGQTGYYNHPILKTPNLDEMADNGLRLDRFLCGWSGLFSHKSIRTHGPNP